MEERRKELLIIFYRNPVLGKVKTRLAATLGAEKALWIYNQLAEHTQTMTRELEVEKAVFYSDDIVLNDRWDDSIYSKYKQQGVDLGERVHKAFSAANSRGNKSICIIGTDCLQLSASIIRSAFDALLEHDAVIGPALDGGYYLVGLSKCELDIFYNKKWGTNTVCEDTISDFMRLGLSYSVLPLLNDIDVESDLPPSIKEVLIKI